MTEGCAVGWALAPAWRWHTGMERPKGIWEAEAGFIPRGLSHFAFLSFLSRIAHNIPDQAVKCFKEAKTR